MVSLLFTHAFYTAARGVYCTVSRKTAGNPSERKGRLSGDCSGCAFSVGDHQRPAPAGVCVQRRSAGGTGQLFVFSPSAVLCLFRLDDRLHGFCACQAPEQKPHTGQRKKEACAVCYRLHNGSLRVSLSVGTAGCTLVVRRYECDVLPVVCRDLRKLHTLSDDTVQHGICRAFRGNDAGCLYCGQQRKHRSPLPCRL